jgi:predicted protein tyrosine phosphatase
MSTIHVCALQLVGDLAAKHQPSHILSLLGGISPFPETPAGIEPHNHLKMLVADISEPQEGMIIPGADHMQEVIAFGERWWRESGGQKPLLVHCHAGISRSTASALAIACALMPGAREADLARNVRTLSPSAQPNRLMIAHADELLNREGRLIDAVEGMSLREPRSVGIPFALRIATNKSTHAP